MHNSSTKIAIKSNHIFQTYDSSPISGYLLIEDEIISELVPFSSLSLLQTEELSKKYQILDYSEEYVIPGLIDLNVHLNETYEKSWQDIENTTKMAVQGGVTTIIINPIFNKYDDNTFDEIKTLENRRIKLLDKIYVDCALLAYLGPHNLSNIKNLWRDNNIIGFKIFLSPCMQPGLPNFEMKHLNKLARMISEIDDDIFLSIHPEYASGRDLFMSSPLRAFDINDRLDMKKDILDESKFGGGIAGEMEGDDSNKEDDEEDNDDVLDLIKNEGNKEFLSDDIKSSILKRRSADNSKKQEEQSISRLEMMGYCLNEEEKELIRNIENSDDELEFNEESSSDEEEKDTMDTIEQTSERNKDFKLINTKSNNKTFLSTKLELSAKIKIEPAHNPLEPRKSFRSNPLILGLRGVLSSLNTENNQKENKQLPEEEPVITNKSRSPSGLLQRRKQTNSPEHQALSKSEEKNLDLGEFKLNIMEMKKKEPSTNQDKNLRDYVYFLYNHSLSWETNGINLILNAFKSFKNGNILISNISSSSSAFQVRDKKKIIPNLPIYTEVATPFIYFHRKMIKAGQAKYKNSPPIRDQETRNLICDGLFVENLFHVVSSCHLQTDIKFKKIDKGNFRRCMDGLSCLGATLNVLWSKFYIKAKKNNEETKKINELIKKLIFLTSHSPAKITRIDNHKGSLEKGKDADFVVWNPFKMITFRDDDIHLMHKKLYLFRNQKFYGEVKATFLRGNNVYLKEENKFSKGGKIIGNKNMTRQENKE